MESGRHRVTASISDAGVKAQLNTLLAKMQAAAKQMSAALTITPGVAASQGQSAASQQVARAAAARSTQATVADDVAVFARGEEARSGIAAKRVRYTQRR